MYTQKESSYSDRQEDRSFSDTLKDLERELKDAFFSAGSEVSEKINRAIVTKKEKTRLKREHMEKDVEAKESELKQTITNKQIDKKEKNERVQSQLKAYIETQQSNISSTIEDQIEIEKIKMMSLQAQLSDEKDEMEEEMHQQLEPLKKKLNSLKAHVKGLVTEPTYELMYFDVRARGELIRLLFSAAEIPFKDTRIEFKDWPTLKSNVPHHCLPILKVTHANTTHILSQSMAIARYIANKYDLSGDTDLERAQIDGTTDLLKDVFDDTIKVHFSTDAKDKKQLLDKFINESLPNCLKILEAQLKANKYGFLVGEKISMADLMFFNTLDRCEYSLGIDLKGVFKHYPLAEAHMKKVSHYVTRWLKYRPDGSL